MCLVSTESTCCFASETAVLSREARKSLVLLSGLTSCTKTVAASQIYKKVKPLMDALEAAQEAKAAAIADLAKVRSRMVCYSI